MAERLLEEALVGHDIVTGGPVGRRRDVGGDDRGPPIVRAQPQQDRGEVRVRGQDDELVEPRRVLERVEHVHHHVDVGTGLAALGQRWAVDGGEGSPGIVAAEAPERYRVEVAAANQDAARRCRGLHSVEGVSPALEPGEPAGRLGGKALRRALVELGEAEIDVVEIDEECGAHACPGAARGAKGLTGRVFRETLNTLRVADNHL